jgi:integrase-like protein
MITDTSLSGQKVAAALSQVVAERGMPVAITVDNGTEFASKAMDIWSYQYGVQLDFIRPGRPAENGYIESFNGRLRDECLNVHMFFTLADVRDKLECWRDDYNRVRPHSAIGDHAPSEFAGIWRSSAVARSAGPAQDLPAGALHCAPASTAEPVTLFGLPSAEAKGRAEKLLPEAERSTSSSVLPEVLT